MLSQFFSQYSSAILIVAVLAFALARSVSGVKRSRRREKPDPAPVFGPIRGMYVCYQCDLIFNTAQCPGCQEEAKVPLIHLTGSILEDERVSAVTNRISPSGSRNLPALPRQQPVQPVALTNSSNGDSAEVPVRILFAPESGRELS
ncbi:MAG: hypothetical protein ACP5IL_16380 [Syntrophobacteraceae bacterium]